MAFYEQFVTFEKESGEQSYALCPLHHDTNASFTVNKETNEWYCHGCGIGGSYAEFIEAYYDVGRDIANQAVKMWQTRRQFPFPTEEYVNGCTEKLWSKPAERQVLIDFGITEKVMKEFKLGWDDMRITIPIYSKTKRLINVRKYLPPHRRIEGSTNAKCIGVRGCNEARFFPYTAFEKNEIYIVEGEKDCLAAISQGINAVTSTGGSNPPLHEEALFKDKTVYLMVDNDPAGERLKAHYQRTLTDVAKSLKIIRLPCKDFVDYWVQYKNTDFAQYTEDSVLMNDIRDITEETTSLVKSEFVENLNTWVSLEHMCVIGVDPKTYTVPNRLKVKCVNHACTKPCRIGTTKTAEEIEIDPRQILQFVDSSDDAQDKYLKKLFSCKSIIGIPAAYINVQKIIFQETASFVDGLDEATFEPRYGIYMYEESRLIPTVKYNFVACRVTDPRNQQNYYVIKSAEAVQMSVTDALDVTYFQTIANECKSGLEIIEKHYDKWEAALGIEGRADLFGALMLTYASVTEVPWKNDIIKGWLDTMVIGDTRTGKSQMAQRLVKRLQMGSYINGENARRTGVIGGVQKSSDSWIITWGAIPMNDKGLLIIDEASGLEIEDIKELSATRSSGAVTINKIAKGEARARTRLVWLSNPRSGKNIEDFYWKGYGAFTEFIPVVEDQARYDLVLSAAREDVKELKGVGAVNLDESKYRGLFNFAWNTSRDDITIDNTTALAVEKAVKVVSEKYEGGPLVVSVAVHEKILRLACAFAVLTGSIKNKYLIVQPVHVDYALEFLEATLSKPTLDYKSFIEETKKATRERSKNIEFVKALITAHPAIKILLSASRFKGSQISEVLGVERSESSRILSDLLMKGLIKMAPNGAYQADKLLIDITRQMEVK